MAVFESRTELAVSPEQLFDFISRPANLQAIAPPEMQMAFVNPPEVIVLGSQLTCKVVAYGQVQQLTYEIVEFDAPNRFREKGIGGPLPKWIHDYIVESNSGQGAILLNRIEFEPPGGLLGFLVTEGKILDHLEEGFHHRREALVKRLGA